MTKEEFKASVYKAFQTNDRLEPFLECVGQLYVDNCHHSSSWVKASDRKPSYNREVIALQSMPLGPFRVVYAHCPDPNDYVVINGKKYYAKNYDGWNWPHIEFWLDMDLPYKEL